MSHHGWQKNPPKNMICTLRLFLETSEIGLPILNPAGTDLKIDILQWWHQARASHLFFSRANFLMLTCSHRLTQIPLWNTSHKIIVRTGVMLFLHSHRAPGYPPLHNLRTRVTSRSNNHTSLSFLPLLKHKESHDRFTASVLSRSQRHQQIG